MGKITKVAKNNFLYKFLCECLYAIGYGFIKFCATLGRFSIFTYKLLASSISKQVFFRNFFSSLYTNGFCSIPVVGLTGFFTGAVLALQLFTSLKMFGIEDSIPYIVLVALMKELAPVLCGLMVVARVGSSMSAEIGSMKTNNQIDVLTSMSINKYRFLFLPRIFSMFVAQPLLTTIGILTGIIGSFFVSTNMFGFTDLQYWHLIYDGFEFPDYMMSIVKGACFGILISLIACYEGDKTKEGAVGVKKTTISTVVVSCVFILMFNFLITCVME